MAPIAAATATSISPAMVFVGGIALGLGAAMPIGPVNVEIARRVIRYGQRAGAALGLGAVTVDVTYALLSTLSFTRVLSRPVVVQPLAAVGALVLIYLGVSSLRAAAKAWRVDPLASELNASAAMGSTADPTRRRTNARSAYLTGVVITLLSPMTLLFWFAVVGTQASGSGSTEQTATGLRLAVMCAGVFVGTLAWVAFFSTLLAWATSRGRSTTNAGNDVALPGDRLRRRWLATADAIGGAMLLAFAGVALWRLFRLTL